MTGVAAVVFMAAMGAGWIFRALLLKALRDAHPADFDALGRPTGRQLASLLPRYRETQLRFWKYLWGGQAFRLGDGRIASLAWAAVISDIVLVAGMILLFWSAGQGSR